MLNSRRSLRAAASAVSIAALAVAAPPAAAQDNATVGPPQLRDFRLPGQRTTPPAQAPTPAPTPPPAQAAPARPAPAAASPVRREPAPRPAPRRAPQAAATRAAPPPAVTPPAPEVQTQPPAPAPAVPPPQAPAQPLPPPAAPAPAPFSWLWLLLLIPVAALAGGFMLLRSRRRQPESEPLGASLGAARWLDEPAPEPDAAPAPEPEPEPEPAAEPQARAWLELEVTPDKAAATDADAIVHFELVLRNTGALPARNIRIDSRLFNAAGEAEIAAFLGGPIHDKSGSPHIAVQPGESLTLGSAVAMKREEVREILIQGRAIFVPALAINVAYDWDGGAASGRTSRAWLIGREAEGSDKMGPFRLDLGPRVYRQVGARDTKTLMA
jgi:hypothetical protein